MSFVLKKLKRFSLRHKVLKSGGYVVVLARFFGVYIWFSNLNSAGFNKMVDSYTLLYDGSTLSIRFVTKFSKNLSAILGTCKGS